ncbi:GntR family transcriptional regulator [Bradyrhizobium sp. USDA 336]|uniref:GntR family transcriptional regulator n=1 Tax=Bradyrhizobium sp. USDA 336 TaxID=3156311 RepID=UPI00383644B7
MNLVGEEVTQKTRVQDAYERLKRDILDNRMPINFQATESEIAERLGMSRTPVREALIRLEAEGLVSLTSRRGARVLPISASDMRDIYQILTALEAEAVAAIARKRPERETLTPMIVAVADMQRALEIGSLDDWSDADDRFHRHLLEINGNQRMTNTVNALVNQFHRARRITLKIRKLPLRSTEEHRLVVELMLAGDAEKAREVMRAHRIRAAEELLPILEDLGL